MKTACLGFSPWFIKHARCIINSALTTATFSSPHFTDEHTEAEEREVVCPRDYSPSPRGSISPGGLRGYRARPLAPAYTDTTGFILDLWRRSGVGRRGSKRTLGLTGPVRLSSGCLQLWDNGRGFLLWLPGWEKGRAVAFLSSGTGGSREIIKG